MLYGQGSISSSNSSASFESSKMLESFFFGKPGQSGAAETFPLITLLSGPPSCGKTSLLFQFAINRVLQTRGNVVFICNRRRLEYKPPFLSQGVNPSDDVLERIETKYIEDYEGIIKYFAAFHLHKDFPSTVIIDDFGEFFIERNCQHIYGNSRGRDLAMARSLALCQDAVVYANRNLGVQGSCNVLLADTHQGDNPRLLFIYKRWVQCFLTIQGDVYGSFTLKKSSISGNLLEKLISAKYSIARQSLQLEEIFEG